MTAIPRVVGVDLSLTSTGLAAPAGLDTLLSRGRKGDGLDSRGSRLREIRDGVLDWCTGADLVVIEAPSYGPGHGSKHDRSGLWWLVVTRLMSWESTVIAEVPPANRAKYATGKGNAAKDQVLAAVVRRFPMFEIDDNNQADALVLMAMGLDHLGWPLVVMPDLHRSALAAIHWPDLPSATQPHLGAAS